MCHTGERCWRLHLCRCVVCVCVVGGRGRVRRRTVHHAVRPYYAMSAHVRLCSWTGPDVVREVRPERARRAPGLEPAGSVVTFGILYQFKVASAMCTTSFPHKGPPNFNLFLFFSIIFLLRSTSNALSGALARQRVGKCRPQHTSPRAEQHSTPSGPMGESSDCASRSCEQTAKLCSLPCRST